jgi:hypothetical protein
MVHSPLPPRKRDPTAVVFPLSSDEDDQDSELDVDSPLHLVALRSGVKDYNSSDGEGRSKEKEKEKVCISLSTLLFETPRGLNDGSD